MARVQRRLGVIVCADVLGQSPPAGADEIGPPIALKAHREAIDPLFLREGGRFVETTGHGLLLEFPSAFNAMRASLGVQRLMAERNAEVPADQQLVFRMGIHLGDVIVENEDIFGDGINAAERLQEIADPGGICLSRAAHAAIHQEFDSLFPDGGTKTLKDDAPPTHIYKLARDSCAALLPPPAMTVPRRLLALVVLPFINSSGEARNDFLADSITDQLTTELARIEDSFVVDRKTAMAYRGDTPDVTELGHKLGIRYAIKGSVCAAAGGLRVTAELIDAEDGQTVWGDGLDLAVDDPFVMQHDVNARLVPLLYARLRSISARTPQAAPEPQIVLQPRAPEDAAARPARVPAMVIHPRVFAASPPDFAPERPALQWSAPPPAPPALVLEQPVLRWPVPPPAPPALVLERPVLRWPVPVSAPPAPEPQTLVQPPPPENAPAPIPATIIHPRVFAPPIPNSAPARPALRWPAPRPAPPPAASAPRPPPARIVEMPTPPLTDTGRYRPVPFLWRLFLALVFAVIAGGIAVALLGVQRDTVVEIASWMLIAAGVSQLASAFVELARPEAVPARRAPGGDVTARAAAPAVGIVVVRGASRLPSISDSRRPALSH